MKLKKIKDKEEILKVGRGKKMLPSKDPWLELQLTFQMETKKTMKWFLQYDKEKQCQQKVL